MTDRAKAIRRVRALRAKAASSTFIAEAHACRAKADTIAEAHGLTAADLEPTSAPLRPPRPAYAPTVVITGVTFTGAGWGNYVTGTSGTTIRITFG